MRTFLQILFASRAALLPENLFLRKQLALYKERKIKPRRRTTRRFRLLMVLLAECFPWRQALVVVKPETFVQWHRLAFKQFWRWKSRRGRPPLPHDVRNLIREVGRANLSWGEERIAHELSLKLGLRVSPATVRKYLDRPPGGKAPNQRWSTFVRNHARAIVACDFLTAVTADFRSLYIFIAMEIGSRRILHYNITAHPNSEWTLH